MSGKREIQRGLAEKKLKRMIEEEIKAASPLVPRRRASQLEQARAMAQYSGLTEKECLGFVQYGRW